MPFKMTDYLEALVLNLILRGSNTAATGPLYLGLLYSFTEANDGSSYAEVSTFGSGYARQSCPFDAFSAGTSQNSGPISFPMATADWGTPTHMGLFDALSGGNMLYWGPITNPDPIPSGEQFEVPAGGVGLEISGLMTPALASQIGEHTCRGNALSSPAQIWAAVLTAFVSESVYTELAIGSYSRKQVTFSAPTGTPTACASLADANFGASASPYSATHLALFDASSGGTMLLRGPLSPPRTLTTGKVFKLPVGAIQVTAD